MNNFIKQFQFPRFLVRPGVKFRNGLLKPWVLHRNAWYCFVNRSSQNTFIVVVVAPAVVDMERLRSRFDRCVGLRTSAFDLKEIILCVDCDFTCGLSFDNLLYTPVYAEVWKPKPSMRLLSPIFDWLSVTSALVSPHHVRAAKRTSTIGVHDRGD